MEEMVMFNGPFGLPRFASLCRVLFCLSAPQIEIEKPLAFQLCGITLCPDHSQ